MRLACQEWLQHRFILRDKVSRTGCTYNVESRSRSIMLCSDRPAILGRGLPGHVVAKGSHLGWQELWCGFDSVILNGGRRCPLRRTRRCEGICRLRVSPHRIPLRGVMITSVYCALWQALSSDTTLGACGYARILKCPTNFF